MGYEKIKQLSTFQDTAFGLATNQHPKEQPQGGCCPEQPEHTSPLFWGCVSFVNDFDFSDVYAIRVVGDSDGDSRHPATSVKKHYRLRAMKD